jgi:purine/pyrimidine-nucleoside phosphorylase
MSEGMELNDATIHARANVYFEGRVISHTVITADGQRKTVGVILPGTYHFGTKLSEQMEIIEGAATVILDGSSKEVSYTEGDVFEVAVNSGFTITVNGNPCHYICSFLSE